MGLPNICNKDRQNILQIIIVYNITIIALNYSSGLKQ